MAERFHTEMEARRAGRAFGHIYSGLDSGYASCIELGCQSRIWRSEAGFKGFHVYRSCTREVEQLALELTASD